MSTFFVVCNRFKKMSLYFMIICFFILFLSHNKYLFATYENYELDDNDIFIKIGEYGQNIKVDIQVIFFYEQYQTIMSNQIEMNYIIYRNDDIFKSDSALFDNTNYNLNEGGFIFEDCNENDYIIIKDVNDYINDEFNNQVKINVYVDDYLCDVSIKPNDLLNVVDIRDTGIVIELLESSTKLPTESNFVDLGGSYSIEYLLKNYNVFCFDDLQATHIIGPVIVGDEAYRTVEPSDHTGQLIVSDYSNGVVSYVDKILIQENSNFLEIGLNYGYDKAINYHFDTPVLYSNYKDNDFVSVYENWEHLYYFVDDYHYYLAPNSHGRGDVLQNDSFIDFSLAKDLLLEESISMKNNYDYIQVSPDLDTGYLSIKAGYSYLVTNADHLRALDIIYPDGFDPKTNLYPYNTNIFIDENNLVMSNTVFDSNQIITENNNSFMFSDDLYPLIDNQIHQFFPVILVNGIAFNGGGGIGQGIEFGDNGGVVFNMPNLELIPIALQPQTDILGHIIAPNNDFYNYTANDNGDSIWNGGNINGSVIVNSWNGGFMQMHMWPYDSQQPSLSIDNVEFEYVFNKVIENATISDYTFLFEMNLVSGTLTNYHFPITLENDKNGEVKINNIYFDEIGEYIFELKEINDSKDNIEYDENVYFIKVIVDEYDNELVITTITDVDDIVFQNEFKKELFFDIEFQKVESENYTGLSNAVFELVEVDLYLNEIKDTNIKCSSDSNGYIKFVDLDVSKLYRLEEISAPSGFSKVDGYWYISCFEVDGNLNIEINTSNENMMNILNYKILNDRIDFFIPSTGGSGTMIYVGFGTFLLLVDLLFLLKKEREKF